MFVALRRLERGEAGLQRHGEHALGGQLVQPEVLVAELLDQGLPPAGTDRGQGGRGLAGGWGLTWPCPAGPCRAGSWWRAGRQAAPWPAARWRGAPTPSPCTGTSWRVSRPPACCRPSPARGTPAAAPGTPDWT